MAVTHICQEIRVGVPARTFCGIEVKQWRRDEWVTTAARRTHNPISITRRDIMTVTCERCFRSCD